VWRQFGDVDHRPGVQESAVDEYAPFKPPIRHAPTRNDAPAPGAVPLPARSHALFGRRDDARAVVAPSPVAAVRPPALGRGGELAARRRSSPCGRVAGARVCVLSFCDHFRDGGVTK
jgi:hypothetical protein